MLFSTPVIANKNGGGGSGGVNSVNGFTGSVLISFGTEVPGGTIDGTNTVFTVSHAPDMFFWNGQYQNPVIFDYTYVAGTITMATAPQPGDNIVSRYLSVS